MYGVNVTVPEQITEGLDKMPVGRDIFNAANRLTAPFSLFKCSQAKYATGAIILNVSFCTYNFIADDHFATRSFIFRCKSIITNSTYF